MRTIEVLGAPGVGKSTIFNPLWEPSVPWDGEGAPASWSQFLAGAWHLSSRIGPGKGRSHWDQMFVKAVRKMATLKRSPDGGLYAGVGLAMRGLDLAWRIPRADDIGGYFRAMPLPAAAVSLYADVETIQARNRERGKERPSRELSRLAPLLEAPQAMAVAILSERGVPVLELDTREPVDANRARVIAFASGLAAAA